MLDLGGKISKALKQLRFSCLLLYIGNQLDMSCPLVN